MFDFLCHQVPLLRKPGGGRRRQLVFADPEVQISERAMKEQIVNPLAETLSMVHTHSEILFKWINCLLRFGFHLHHTVLPLSSLGFS